MKLSIIVPVYNMASDGKLEFCLNSLVNQRISDYEIIAVDDCSTDESPQILKRYEEKYPTTIKVVCSDVNRKQGGAKNIGLSLARGEWISFVDSDDWVSENYYSILLEKAEETGADMVGCDYHLTSEHNMEIGQVVHNNRVSQTGILDHDKYASLILDSGSLVVKIYRREIVLGHSSRFPEGIFYEDNAIANSWMLRAKHFEYVPQPLYYYYQHEQSTVHTISKERCLHRMEAGRRMVQEAIRFSYLEEYRQEIEFSFAVLFYINTMFSYLSFIREGKRSEESFRDRCHFIKQMGKEIRQIFPLFQKNRYFLERINQEEQRLIKIQQKSTILFLCYYQILWKIRNFRRGKTNVQT